MNNYWSNLLQQPSTYRGLTLLAGSGLAIQGVPVETIFTVVSTLIGLIETFVSKN